MTPLLHANGLVRDYNDPPTRTRKRILHGIDLHVAPGESLGIIGESGSGKSTLARILMGLEPPDEGTVSFRGADLFGPARRALRPHIQAVFQDPYGSLDPRQRVGAIVAEPLITLGERRAARQARVAGALEAVNLPADAARKYPHAFSGGQRQRIAIARALITRPALLIADEPVSALDVSVQAQVLNLLLDLRTRLGLACVFISHDLAVIRHVAQRVLVLQAGRIVEQGETAALLRNPAHPFTRSLIDAMPASPVRA
jgi:peptide/nickel transport system ATP-binding protein